MTPARRVRRIAEGRSLNGPERLALIAEILASYARARRAMRAAPIESAVQSLRHREQLDRSREEQARLLGEAQRLGGAVQRTLRLVPGDTRCLMRSLVLTQLLSRRGIQAKLVIGARSRPSFLAHAWVEFAGQPVLPAGDGSFGRLVEL